MDQQDHDSNNSKNDNSQPLSFTDFKALYEQELNKKLSSKNNNNNISNNINNNENIIKDNNEKKNVSIDLAISAATEAIKKKTLEINQRKDIKNIKKGEINENLVNLNGLRDYEDINNNNVVAENNINNVINNNNNNNNINEEQMPDGRLFQFMFRFNFRNNNNNNNNNAANNNNVAVEGNDRIDNNNNNADGNNNGNANNALANNINDNNNNNGIFNHDIMRFFEFGIQIYIVVTLLGIGRGSNKSSDDKNGEGNDSDNSFYYSIAMILATVAIFKGAKYLLSKIKIKAKKNEAVAIGNDNITEENNISGNVGDSNIEGNNITQGDRNNNKKDLEMKAKKVRRFLYLMWKAFITLFVSLAPPFTIEGLAREIEHDF